VAALELCIAAKSFLEALDVATLGSVAAALMSLGRLVLGVLGDEPRDWVLVPLMMYCLVAGLLSNMGERCRMSVED